MVGRQQSGRSNAAFPLDSLRQRLQNVGRSTPRLDNPQSTPRQVPSWVVPESADDDTAVDDIGEDDYARDDEPVDVSDQYRPLAELPRALRTGFGGRQGSDRGGNGGSGALRNFGRPRPYDAIIEGLPDRLQAELRAEGAAAAGHPRGTIRQGLPGRVTRRPNPTAAERARRRVLERNIRGIPFLSKNDSEPPVLSSGDVPSINLRHYLDPNRPLRSPFPRFEKNLLNILQFGNFDKDAIRYYLSMISQSGSSHGYPPEFGNLDVILANDARPKSEGIVRQQWTPTKILGSGSYGEVILWQRVTNFAMRPESLVCKTTRMDSFFLDWNEEAVLTQKLNAAGCPNVLKVYDWNHNKHENLARIIYEYCPHGDLQSLIDFYDTQQLVFPEAFLWHIFQSVATAICYCARGTTDDEPRPGWTEIVHKDLKPNNIFLSPPDNDENPLYPTLKVADFGLGYQIPNETIRQFKRSYRSLANVFGAPEVHDELRSDKNQTPYDLPSSRLDIYSLGIIMLLLLQMPIPHYTPPEWECLDLALPYSHKYYPYSSTLVTLARACVHPDARQRPDPLTLYRDTHSYAQAMAHDTVALRRHAYAQGSPAGVYNGKVLWLAADMAKYSDTDTYRRAFRRHADWFGRHAQEMIQLEVAALEPRCPPRRGLVGVGNGLGGFLPEAEVRRLVAGGGGLRRFEERVADGGVPNLQYVGVNRLRLPRYNEFWREREEGVGRRGKEEEEEEEGELREGEREGVPGKLGGLSELVREEKWGGVSELVREGARERVPGKWGGVSELVREGAKEVREGEREGVPGKWGGVSELVREGAREVREREREGVPGKWGGVSELSAEMELEEGFAGSSV